MTGADAFLKRHGMDPERMELDTYTEAFLTQMERGLCGRTSSIGMLPAYLSTRADFPKGKPVLVLDAGGTNLRAATVTLTGEGSDVDDLHVIPMPGSDGRVTWEAFIHTLTELILPMEGKSDRIGFCFSYPAEITPDRDGKVLRLTKQVQIANSTGQLLGACLNRELIRRKLSPKKIAVLNDTTAAVMSGAAAGNRWNCGGFMGLVYGTGVNTCCSVPVNTVTKLSTVPDGCSHMLLNLESGGFSDLAMGDLDRVLDASSVDPGSCIYEKMVSGAYLGELIRLTLWQAGADGLFSAGMSEGLEALSVLDAPQADAFCHAPWGDNPLARICRTDGDRQTAYRVIERLTERAARLVCANLAAMFLLTGEGSDSDRPVCIMREGSAIERNRFIRPVLERLMTDYLTGKLHRHWVLRSTKNGNFQGAAAAALMEPG